MFYNRIEFDIFILLSSLVLVAEFLIVTYPAFLRGRVQFLNALMSCGLLVITTLFLVGALPAVYETVNWINIKIGIKHNIDNSIVDQTSYIISLVLIFLIEVFIFSIDIVNVLIANKRDKLERRKK